MSNKQDLNIHDCVAIIGMAGRFPGADSVDAFWRNLLAGKESITFFKDEELAGLVLESERNNPQYVPANGILDDIDMFDADFFSIPPIEAQIMDPQQRLFLEICWEALEHSGYTAEKFDGLIGVYGGMNNNSYYLRNVLSRPDIVKKFGPFQAMLANEKDFLTTRVSYKLNLTGPSENIFTACSTSLVAIAKAFQALLTYQCDMALAGGISITVPQNTGYLYQEGGMLSPDGHCRPFDKNAKGTTFNNGAGLVVLKRYDDALADNDHIIAIIRGTGLNNDGGDKVSFTAPSVNGQKDAIRMAVAQADISPETISYVETHGTGTPMGDPVEVSALAQAFALPPGQKTCLLGSVKSNVGHLIHAAGVAGLIKTSLALSNKVIPPTIFHESPNPHISWEKIPFSVCSKTTDWPSGKTARRAGVSSFGVGGTNAHVILEEHNLFSSPIPSSLPYHLVPLTARTTDALVQQGRNLSEHVKSHNQPIADIAYTLQNGRKHFNHRSFGIFQSTEDISKAFDTSDKSLLSSAHVTQRSPDIVFLFPGQGAQHLKMASGLYKYNSHFQSIIDKGAEILQQELKLDLRSLLFSDDSTDAEKLKQTSIAQPALFLIEYALAQIWKSLGVQPAAMIGHSIGELTAACLAGVFTFEDGLLIVARRGALMQSCPSGNMLSVRLPASEVESKLSDDLVLSTINAPQLCVVGGAADTIALFHDTLNKDEIPCQILHTSHAFHTPAMEKAAEEFVQVVKQFNLSPPAIPFISCVSGNWVSTDQAISGEYWGEQIRRTVQFSKGISLALDEQKGVFLEVGPLTSTATLARQHLAGRKVPIISTLGRQASAQQDYFSFLSACGHLWLNGVEVNWPDIYQAEQRSRIPLPTYPFERKRFWLDPGDSLPSVEAQITTPSNKNNSNGDNVTSDVSKHITQQPIIDKLAEIILESSGIEIDSTAPEDTFLEVGLDSLFLTQLATTISNEFEIKVTFRQLMDELSSPALLAENILLNADPSRLPTEIGMQETTPPSPAPLVTSTNPQTSVPPAMSAIPVPDGSLQALLSQQLQIISQQLEIITKHPSAETKTSIALPQQGDKATPLAAQKSPLSEDSTSSKKPKAFGAAARINTETEESLTAEQNKFLEELIASYTGKTRKSKEFAAKNRKRLADPRTVSGFRPLFKEMIYQIVVSKSSGCKLEDLDGNEYVDMLNGFGSNFLGYSPDFVTKAVSEQMQRGIEIGPQHPLTEEVAELMAEFTGLDRFAFCNTGSEAVLGCMRIARTVTGKKTVVLFNGAYHGIFDEVIVRGTPSLKSFSAAPGINQEAVSNTLVLEYDSKESLKIIKERSKEIAAILVEPVQSRNPALQPQKFLHQLREIATQTGAALIIDEVITGFRVHPGGSQAYFNVEADLATYGKVIGGGLPIGIIGGKKRFMDALDGGQWQYADNSFPEVGVTYFAGTFVRHPMALASCKAVLKHLKQQGGDLQKSVNRKADSFCRELNTTFKTVNAPLRIDHFGSLMKIQFEQESPFNELLYFMLRERGVHAWDARPIFLTTAHTKKDLELVKQVFAESINLLQSAGFMSGGKEINEGQSSLVAPPVPGARLGKTPDGTPAWFIADPDRPGKYRQLS